MPAPSPSRLQEKRAKLEAELETLRKQERDEEDRRCLIAGRVVLTHALEDRAFGEQLMQILSRAITKQRERKLFGLSSPARARRTRASETADSEG